MGHTPDFATVNTPILRFTKEAKPFLAGQACQNIAVFAATASGKTTAIDSTIGVAMLANGFGMLKTCVKGDAIEDLENWAAAAGRSDDLVDVTDDGRYIFECLTWAMNFGGPTFASQMLRELRETLSRGRLSSNSSDNAFFEDKADLGNSCVMHVCHEAIGKVDPDECLKIWNTIPTSEAQVYAKIEEEKTHCVRMCEQAWANQKDQKSKAAKQLARSIAFLLEEMMSTDIRPRSSIIITATIPWQAITRPPLCDCFLGEGNIDPSALNDGAIIGINVDGKFGAAAIGVNVIWKFASEHYTLSRVTRGVKEDDLRPICLFLSEGDKVLSSHDSRFSSLCRSARGCYYISCQSVNGMFSEIGADPTARSRVLSLLGNCNTHIYGCTCDDETLDFAEKTFGETLVFRPAPDGDVEFEPFFGKVVKPKGESMHLNPTYEHDVRREQIQKLFRGHEGQVGAFVRTLGKEGIEKYACTFSQNLSDQRRSWLGSIFAPDTVQIL